MINLLGFIVFMETLEHLFWFPIHYKLLWITSVLDPGRYIWLTYLSWQFISMVINLTTESLCLIFLIWMFDLKCSIIDFCFTLLSQIKLSFRIYHLLPMKIRLQWNQPTNVLLTFLFALFLWHRHIYAAINSYTVKKKRANRKQTSNKKTSVMWLMQLLSHLCHSFYRCNCGYGETSSFIPSCTAEDGAVNRLFLVEESHQAKSDHLAPTLLIPRKEAQIFEKWELLMAYISKK